ncbi:MAG: efflux RND transporter periplasmic adaptor subunit [Synechococcales cyanobacterium M58_A2018_015]|nr:efflux RND transporter periplasmic adaptor subunit [Synechococcales cyanobacterium M58_A2018_015]
MPQPISPRLASLQHRRTVVLPFAAVLITSGLIAGCGNLPRSEAQPAQQGDSEGVAAVETAIAQTGSLDTAIEYTGTTVPVRRVALRAQTEGRLLDLTVDVGDRVNQGQVLGQVDNRLLAASVNQERAELAALQSEVAQAEAEVSNARAQVEQAQVELQQAQADADRLLALSREGAITTQAAEQAVTAARTAEQTLRSAQEQVRTRQQAVVAAERRVAAQQATLAEVQARKAFSSLTSPISGAVLERTVQPGDLVQPGDEVLQLGDFSAVKVSVQVSELELGTLRVGQPAEVRLDAFPNQTLTGEIVRISPAADPTARLIPVEVTIPNPEGRIGSGLLARVQFQTGAAPRVVIPQTALDAAGEGNQSTLFVVSGSGEAAKALARTVQLGEARNGQVEVRSGLQPGEAFVVRSSQPLQDNQPVRLSILSETAP